MARKPARSFTRKAVTQRSSKPTISIVGPGRLGSALALALHKTGYTIDELITRTSGQARGLARTVGARPVAIHDARLGSDIIWLTVGDSAIRSVAHQLAANRGDWTNTIAFHSSGALTSDELGILRNHGAAVASVHPLMTFTGGAPPSLVDVLFALEGDARAVRHAKIIVDSFGAFPVQLKRDDKAAYHAWASFASPLLVALLAAAEPLAPPMNQRSARRALVQLAEQTLANYAEHGAPAAFTGPLVRGDVATIQKHLNVIGKNAVVRDTYVALAKAALELLPVGNKEAIDTALDQSRGTARPNSLARSRNRSD